METEFFKFIYTIKIGDSDEKKEDLTVKNSIIF